MNVFEQIKANNNGCLKCDQQTLEEYTRCGITIYICKICKTVHSKYAFKIYIPSPDLNKHILWKV